MQDIDHLIRKMTPTQLTTLSSDATKIRLLVPTSNLIFTTTQQHLDLKYGDFVLIPPSFDFALKIKRTDNKKNQPKTSYYLFEIPAEFFEDKNWVNFFGSKTLTTMRTTIPTVTIFIDAFEFLFSEIKFKRLAYQEAIDHFLNFICIHIERTYANYNNLDSHRVYQKERDFFHSINMYINSNYQENLTNKNIADHFYISENKLKQLYKKYSEKSAHDTLISRRLISCKDLVLEGTPVTEAAKMVGYSNYSTFYRQFIHYFGKSPKEYFSNLL